MKHIINTICLTAVLLLFCGGTAFLLLAACSSADGKANPAADELFAEKDSALARADAFSDTIVIKYARGLQVRYLPEGIRVTITNPDPRLPRNCLSHSLPAASSVPRRCSWATSRCWVWRTASWE